MSGVATLAAAVPVLTTERLVLREPRMGDLPAVAAFSASDRTQFLGGPQAGWQAWNVLAASVGHWLLRGFGWWVIEDRATGATAGRAGIGEPPDFPEPELGWQVYDGFEGRGLAREAAEAARRWWRGQGHPAPISIIDPQNLRSRRLAERLGATVESEATIRGKTCLVYRHPQEAA